MATDPGNSAEEQLQQLCFNRSHFQRADFNVERFVNLARKRATLEQLHNDLRTYLRYLQNSMVELINDDYADFVNLSSGLAALRESVEKVNDGVKSGWSLFFLSIADIEKCANSIEQCLAELSNARRKQIEARDKLSLLHAIQRLDSFLHNKLSLLKESTNSHWYSKLLLLISSVELWSNRISTESEIARRVQPIKSKCYQKIRDLIIGAICEGLRAPINGPTKKVNFALLLAPLQLQNEMDNAISRVASSVIAPMINEMTEQKGEKQRKDAKLEWVLDEVIKLRDQWIKQAKHSTQFTKEVSKFLDSCLLNFVLSFLNEHFTTVLVPTDARLFHRCYRLVITRLILQWPSRRAPHQSALLRAIRDRFNLMVYFKLVSQPMLLPLKDQSAPEAFTYKLASTDESQFCLCPYSNSVLSTFDALYSPEVFLPTLANKFWEFTLNRLQDYKIWAQTMLDSFMASKHAPKKSTTMTIPTVSSATNIAGSAQSSGGRKSASPHRELSPVAKFHSPKWLSLAVLHRDIQLFDNHLFQFCLSTIWVLLRQLHADPTPFGQSISHFSEQLAFIRGNILQTLVQQIGEELAKNLSLVSEVPRQYRWTKRPQPVGFSPYLATAFSIYDQFDEETNKLGWETTDTSKIKSQAMSMAIGDFYERAEKVLDAVEQTGSSLLRFKRRKAATTGQPQSAVEAAGESDEAKIRAQLCFDTNLVRQRAKEFDVPSEQLERLERLEQRAEAAITTNNNGAVE